MIARDHGAGVQIGDRACYPKHTMVATSAQRAVPVGLAQQGLGAGVKAQTDAGRICVHAAIGARGGDCLAMSATLAGLSHALGLTRRGGERPAAQMLGGGTPHRHQQVDAVKQRPAEAPAMAGEVGLGTGSDRPPRHSRRDRGWSRPRA